MSSEMGSMVTNVTTYHYPTVVSIEICDLEPKQKLYILSH